MPSQSARDGDSAQVVSKELPLLLLLHRNPTQHGSRPAAVVLPFTTESSRKGTVRLFPRNQEAK